MSGGVPTVPLVVPGGWLGAGVLPEPPVLGWEGVVASRGVVGSGGVVEGSVGVMGTGLLLPGDVVLSAVVAAGPSLVLVVTTEVEGRVGSVLGAAPAELVLGAGDALVPSDVPAVTSGWVGIVAAEVGLGGVVAVVLVA